MGLFYRTVWRALVGVLAGLGCVIAIFGVSFATIIGTAIATTVISITITVWRHRSDRRLLPALVRHSAIGVSCAVGFIGISKGAGGGVGMLIALAVFLLSPWLIGRLRRRMRLGRPESKLVDPGHLPYGPVSELSDRQLCLAWTRSHDLLQTTAQTSQRAELARKRQAYLDELERRHPAEFACWLYNHPDPGDDPGPYLLTGH